MITSNNYIGIWETQRTATQISAVFGNIMTMMGGSAKRHGASTGILMVAGGNKLSLSAGRY